MQAGFSKVDITPRVGVDLCGFGPYLNRQSIAVRDRLWARGAAFGAGGQTVVLIGCDLVGVNLDLTRDVRSRVHKSTGLVPEHLMIHCTHTHSGPVSIKLTGWGERDEPYMRLLPRRLAEAARLAIENLAPATLHYNEVPCVGIGYNRERDERPSLREALADDYRCGKPEFTDTTCRVVRAERDGRIVGFMVYYSCHPVVCCAPARHIHGDYAGVAMGLLEQEHPEAVGLFLQGASGDINTCVVHNGELESLRALDVIAQRFARQARHGLTGGRPLQVDSVAARCASLDPSRQDWSLDRLEALYREKTEPLNDPSLDDSDHAFRYAAVAAVSLGELIEKKKAGLALWQPTEVQGLRVGPLRLLGAPFEVFQAIKNDVEQSSDTDVPPLVMGLTGDEAGYAVDRDAAARGGYAADQVPVILGQLPFADIHTDLSRALAELDQSLGDGQGG